MSKRADACPRCGNTDSTRRILTNGAAPREWWCPAGNMGGCGHRWELAPAQHRAAIAGATAPTHGGPRKNSGGKRENAGRPPTALTPRSVSRGPVRLTATEAAQLDARAASRNLSVQEAIRTALRVDGLID